MMKYFYSSCKNGCTSLHYACMNGRSIVAGILLDHEANIAAEGAVIIRKGAKHERKIGGRTAFHWACENGHASTVSLLIERGADIHAKDKVSTYCYKDVSLFAYNA